MKNGILRKVLNKSFLTIIFLIIPLYIFWDTGIHSDDYTVIDQAKNTDFFDFINPNPNVRGQNTFGIFNHYFFYWAYGVFGNHNQWIYDIFKWIIHILSIYLIYIFSLDYLTQIQLKKLL